jgi:uncharacterized protein YdhG (YjbR/CyaY superfamily)
MGGSSERLSQSEATLKRRSSKSKAESRGTFDIDAYLASVPLGAREALQRLRKAISAAAPRAEEGSSYGLPAFRLEGRPLVCYGAATHHCSFYPMSPAVIRAHAEDLQGYETSKGTIRFTADKPLPPALVRKLVKARIVELERVGNAGDKRGQPTAARRKRGT